MIDNETPLMTAARHVADAEVRVRNQAALIERLAEYGHDTAGARRLLTDIETALARSRDRYERLLAETARIRES